MQKTKTNIERPIDKMAKQHYSWWGSSFVFIKKAEIKIWYAVFLIAFFSGVCFTLVWAVSTGAHQYSSASVQPSIAVISPNGGEVWVKGNSYLLGWRILEGSCRASGSNSWSANSDSTDWGSNSDFSDWQDDVCTIDFVRGNTFVKNGAMAASSGRILVGIDDLPDANNYRVCIRRSDSTVADCSNAAFTITSNAMIR